MDSSSNQPALIERRDNILLTASLAVVAAVVAWIFGGAFTIVNTALLVIFTATSLFLALCSTDIQSRVSLTIQWLALAAVGFGALQIWFPQVIGYDGTVHVSASRTRLAELVLVVTVLVVAIRIFRTTRSFVWFYSLIAINAGMLACFGIVQKLSGTKQIYWLFERTEGGVAFGPFVNRNNAAGYLLLGFAAATWFISRRIVRSSTGDWDTGRKSLTKRFAAALENVWIGFGQLETRQLFQFAGLFVIICGICYSLSRGSMIALAVSILVAWVLFFQYNKASVFLLALLIACGVGAAIWVGQFETVVERIETLGDLEEASPGRINHWAETVPYLNEHWVLGSGLGTYRFTYPAYKTTTFESWFFHAENQYLETICETGLPGAICLFLLIVLIFCCSLFLLKQENPDSRAIGIVGLVALSGQIVAAAFDFGLYLPANSILMALIMGGVVGRVNWTKATATDQTVKPRTVTRFFHGLPGRIALLLCAVCGALACYEYSSVDATSLATYHMKRFKHDSDIAKLDYCESLLAYAEKVRPQSDEVYYQQARLNLLRYRHSAARILLEDAKEITERSRNPNRDQDNPTPPDQIAPESLLEQLPNTTEKAWPLTSITALNRTAWVASRTEPEYFEQLKNDPAVQEYLGKAFELFKKAEEISSLTPTTQYQLAELSILFEEPTAQQERIETAVKRWPTNPTTLFNAGLLHHHAGNVEDSISLWRNCLSRTRTFNEQIFTYARYEMNRRPFFEQLLPQEPEYLFNVANKYFNNPEDKLVRELLLVHTRRVLNEDPDVTDAYRSYLQGEIEIAFGQDELAELHFRKAIELKAIELSPDLIAWRIEYVKLLQRLKKFDEAEKQLKICSLRRDTKYLKAIQRLTIKNRREREKELRPPPKLRAN